MSPLPTGLLERVLDVAPVARLGLVDGENRPYALPIVFARVGDALWSPVDGKPKRHGRLARLERIERAPDVTVLLDHYADDWRELWWIRLEGRASVVEGQHSDWQAAVRALHGKYRQYREVEMFHAEPIMIRFAWRRISWWALAGPGRIRDWVERR
jgi:PPOX class probable F420-dependent enzyme